MERLNFWRTVTRIPPLAKDDTHVWLAELQDFSRDHDRLEESLALEERKRLVDFRVKVARERFLVTRALLRGLLAGYVQTVPSAIAITYEVHGKPVLRCESGQPLQFNVSHAGDFAVFAFNQSAKVGVDIEQVRPDPDRLLQIARRHFAPREAAVLERMSETERARCFFNYWVRKEAFLKARGDGVFGGLASIEVTPSVDCRLLRIDGNEVAARRWELRGLPEVPGYVGALAVEKPVADLHFCRVSLPLLF